MADLLSSLESTLSFVPGIADKLRDHVSRIDHYMTSAALDRSRSGQVFHNALPAEAWSPGSKPPGRVDTSQSPAHSTGSVPLSSDVLSWPGSARSDPPRQVTYSPSSQLLADTNMAPPPLTGPQEFQLPDDLLLDWPIDFSDTFDFLSGVQFNM